MTGQHAASGGGAGPGWWPSPFDAASVAAGKVSRSGLQRHGGALYWTEGRPDLGGRQVVVRAERGEVPRVVSPPGVSVRSRVHEYGGAAVVLAGDRLFYVAQEDQRWYRWESAGERSGPPAAGPDPRGSGPRGVRPPRRRPAHALGEVAGLGGGTGGGGRPRATGWWRWQRTVARWWPRSSTARTSWPPRARHRTADGWRGCRGTIRPCRGTVPRYTSRPSWTRTDGSIGLGEDHCVAGGDGCSVGQPRWCGDGSLVFVDDRSGWWLPYRLPGDRLDDPSAAGPLVELAAEFHAPDWVLGQSTIDELPDGSLVLRMHRDGLDRLVRLVPPPHRRRRGLVARGSRPAVREHRRGGGRAGGRWLVGRGARLDGNRGAVGLRGAVGRRPSVAPAFGRAGSGGPRR